MKILQIDKADTRLLPMNVFCLWILDPVELLLPLFLPSLGSVPLPPLLTYCTLSEGQTMNRMVSLLLIKESRCNRETDTYRRPSVSKQITHTKVFYNTCFLFNPSHPLSLLFLRSSLFSKPHKLVSCSSQAPEISSINVFTLT